MNVLFDTSVWVAHLRSKSGLQGLSLRRPRFILWMDGVVAGELAAGCRTKQERRVVQRLIRPIRGAGRLIAASALEHEQAGNALSRLREDGLTLASPGGALLDALIAVVAVRMGAILVTLNVADFSRLATKLPLRFESLDEFASRW